MLNKQLIILLLLTTSDFLYYIKQSLCPVTDGFYMLPFVKLPGHIKTLRDDFEVPWHFHLGRLCLVTSLNLPLSSISCLLIFYNLGMTAPWIIQGKHLGKMPRRGKCCNQGRSCLHSLPILTTFTTQCVRIKMPSAILR